jgi:hypothetical protein
MTPAEPPPRAPLPFDLLARNGATVAECVFDCRWRQIQVGVDESADRFAGGAVKPTGRHRTLCQRLFTAPSSSFTNASRRDVARFVSSNCCNAMVEVSTTTTSAKPPGTA